MKKILIFLCLFCYTAFSQNALEVYQQSLKKLSEKDTAAFVELAQQANVMAPKHPNIMLNLAKAFAMTGKKTKCIELLDDVSVIGFDYDIEHDSGFKNIWKHSLLKEISERAKRNTKIITSDLAYSLLEKDLISDGITYDPRQQRFYITSTNKHKIIFINTDGTVGDLLTETQYSLLGIKVDAARNQLWVVGQNENSVVKKSALFQYDLDTRNLIYQYVVNDTLQHSFNDLALAGGNIFVTDTKQNAVYKIIPTKQTMELWFHNSDTFLPYGIAVSQDQRFLFIAHWNGIIRVNIGDVQHLQVQTKLNTTLCGIDGLYFYNNTLIGIQNGAGPQSRVMQFELNKEMNSVVRSTILESGNPLFNLPTTGVIVGDEFYFIANSQLRSFNADGTIFSEDKLQPTIILKLSLNN